jgi:hypothetical protein
LPIEHARQDLRRNLDDGEAGLQSEVPTGSLTVSSDNSFVDQGIGKIVEVAVYPCMYAFSA